MRRAIRKSRPNSRIKPRMYVKRSIMCEKRYFVKSDLAGVRKISSVACGFSSIKIHYSVNRINEVNVCFFSTYIAIHSKHLLEWNVVTVCFAAIELAFVLA